MKTFHVKQQDQLVLPGNGGKRITIDVLDCGVEGGWSHVTLKIAHPSFQNLSHNALQLIADGSGEWRLLGFGVKMRVGKTIVTNPETDGIPLQFIGDKARTIHVANDDSSSDGTARKRPKKKGDEAEDKPKERKRRTFSPQEQTGLKSKWARGES